MTGRTPRIFAKTLRRPDPVPVRTNVPFAFVHINKCAGSSVEIALGIGKRHATALAMRASMGAEEWARRFTFTFVRNPFDRVASIYYYRMRTDQMGLADRHLSFNAWVEKIWGEKDPLYLGEPILLAPAVKWINDENGDVIVDHVGRLETLQEDWARIAGVLGVKPQLELTNWNLRPPYRGIFSASSRTLVEAAFMPDLDAFGYDF